MNSPNSYDQGGWVKRGAAVVLGSVLLGACAIPVPLRVTSWALDGIAYLATEKSVTDHGISLVAQQDCALWRGFIGEQICRSEDGPAIAVAAAEGPASGIISFLAPAFLNNRHRLIVRRKAGPSSIYRV